MELEKCPLANVCEIILISIDNTQKKYKKKISNQVKAIESTSGELMSFELPMDVILDGAAKWRWAKKIGYNKKKKKKRMREAKWKIH